MTEISRKLPRISQPLLTLTSQQVKFNIAEPEAVDRVVDLIKELGRWTEPEPALQPQPAV